MNKQELEFFNRLSEDRSDSANTLEKPSMRGVQRSVVDKYSDQAHFIYELIQNADDANATSAKFTLYSDRLVFIHNGKRLFTVTDPAKEDEDSCNGTLGDINAITSIANSNKTDASIGKFGVGFKAVFQYTDTPYIYDPNISFKIERFIVPVLINDSFCEKNENETAFVFPFNHKKISAQEAYADISGKLQNLVFPILFLNNLKKITYQIGELCGEYTKKQKEQYSFGDIYGEFLSLKNGKNKENVYMFSKLTEEGFKYSVCFFVDNKGKLLPKDYYAFCFFPTKATTNLKFIINAPFLLTDSREGIKANDEHNISMISKLSKLAADSLICLRDIGIKKGLELIDDDLLWMLPYDERKFYIEDEGAQISFQPFYDEIFSLLEREEIFLSEGKYVSIDNAYIANSPSITSIFNNSQLSILYDDEEAGWIFKTYGYETIYRARDGRGDYLSSLLQTAVVQDDRIISKITKEFIEQQEHAWLLKLYEFVADTSRRIEVAKSVPLFIDSNGKAVAAFDEEEQEILFLPTPGISGFCVISDEFVKEKIVQKLADQMGLSKPSIRDEIYNKIVYKYKTDEDGIDEIADFKKMYLYYKNCPQSEIDEYVALIQDCEFLIYSQGDETYRTTAGELYYPCEELEDYFSTKKYVRFIDLETYRAEVKPDEYDMLKGFLVALGIKLRPQIIDVQIPRSEAEKLDIDWPKSSAGHAVSWVERRLEGSWELVKYIAEEQDKRKSIILWDRLIEMLVMESSWRFPLYAQYHYYYYSPGVYRFEGPCERLLKNLAWLEGKDGLFHKPSELTLEDLAEEYDISSDVVDRLASYLGISDPVEDDIPDNLSAVQIDALRIGQLVQNAGVSIEDLEAFITQKKSLKEKDEDVFLSQIEKNDGDRDTYTDEIAGQVVKKANDSKKTVDEFVKDLVKSNTKKFDIEEKDEDDFTLSVVDYKKKIEHAKDKSSAEIAKIALLEEAQNRAVETRQYSYGWFRALLDLEILNTSEYTSNSREVHISFAKVEKDKMSDKGLILKYPSQNIPQMMEELTDILLTLHVRDDVKQIPIEVASVKGYTLRVKVKNENSLRNLDAECVTEATIDAQSPIFLLDALKQEIGSFKMEMDYDMKNGLPANIEFIFGPPGTGKTTCLAKEYLVPYIKEKRRVLVLTPTNKAADVVTRRIIENYAGDDVSDWLIRFGVTADEFIEEHGVHKDREYNITKQDHYVVVTTIARLPYDYFMLGNGNNVMLNELDWNYIVFDEASMIPLYQVIYPLYKFKPEMFIFSGDPVQIEPITSVDMWKGQNIYSLVGLNSFEQPITTPYNYSVRLLTTQYRSIPSVGRIYSELSYGGLLKSAREEESQKNLNISDIINLNTLNIIKFPVCKYESVFKSRRINNSSPYHIYSALFTFEFVRFLAEIINLRNYGKKYSIGVVAPYKAQSELIDKLISSTHIPHNISVQVGTIHGFQGDESDIVLAVYNPPPSISDSKDMFLNRQNIINVSVSRAKDYLIVIMPDENTEKVEMLRLVNRIEKLCKASGKCNIFYSNDIEKIMFAQDDYIEENTFSTGHQMVNVYGKPDKKYEIRSEATAVDVQLHDAGKSSYKYSVISKNASESIDEQIIDDSRNEILENEEAEFYEYDDEQEDDIQNIIIGEKVLHTKLGLGTVISCDAKYVEINFNGSVKKFGFPDAFHQYLEAVSSELQGTILSIK